MTSTNSVFSIAKYRVIGTLGRGAMGVVYKAQDPEIGRIVAVKVLRSVEGTEDSQLAAAFEQFKVEARAAGNLRHQNIITVFEVSSEGANPYIVMDYIDGQGLDQVIARQGALRIELALQILMQVAEGLDYAHERGVIHRDIKPSNILVDANGGAFIVDFGVASFGRSTIDPGGPVVGSPGYMSPEQILSKRIEASSDLFSFAILAFEMLAGSRPFDGENFKEVVSQILNAQPRSICALRSEFPEEVDAVFEKAMSKKPSDRFNSAKEFMATLMGALGPIAGVDRGVGRQRAPSHWKPLSIDGSVKRELDNPSLSANLPAIHLRPSNVENERDEWQRPTSTPRMSPNSSSHVWRGAVRPGSAFEGMDDDDTAQKFHRDRMINRAISFIAALILIFAGVMLIWFFVVRKPEPLPVVEAPAIEAVAIEAPLLPEALPLDRYDIPPLGIPVSQLNERQMLGVLAKGEYPVEELLKALVLVDKKQVLGRYEAIVHLLNNDSYLVRSEAIKLLAKSREKRFVGAILTVVEDRDALVRIAAAYALRDLGDRKVVSYLQAQYSKEELPEVKSALRKVIDQLNGYPSNPF